MREQIQTLVRLLQESEKLDQKMFLTLLLDVMAAQVLTVEELEKENRRMKENIDVLARGGKPVSPTTTAFGGFSVG